MAVAMLLPVWYSTECTLLPPPETSDAYGSLAGLIQSSALSTLGLVTTSSTSIHRILSAWARLCWVVMAH